MSSPFDTVSVDDVSVEDVLNLPGFSGDSFVAPTPPQGGSSFSTVSVPDQASFSQVDTISIVRSIWIIGGFYTKSLVSVITDLFNTQYFCHSSWFGGVQGLKQYLNDWVFPTHPLFVIVDIFYGDILTDLSKQVFHFEIFLGVKSKDFTEM